MNKKILGAVLLSSLMWGCVTTSAFDSALSAGGVVDETTMQDHIGSEGVTATAVDDSWVAYWAPDGKKVVKVNKTGEVAELEWRENEAGEFCEQVFSAGGAEFCGDETGVTVVKTSDDVYYNFRNGQAEGGGYRMESGNVHNL